MVARRQQKSSANLSKQPPKDQVVEAEVVQQNEDTSAASKTSAKDVSATDHSELQLKVNELKNSLENAQQTETTLQKTIEQLQTQLDEQKATTEKLQKSLEKSSTLQTELEKAQKATEQAQKTIEQLQTQLDEQKATTEKLQKSLEKSSTLQTELEKAQKATEQLQIQLDEQKATTEKLQKSLEKSSTLQTELEKAQKAAVSLAEANQKLIDDNKALKETQQKPEPQSAKLAAQSNSSESNLSRQESALRQRQVSSLARPVFPGSPEQTDLDIGWAD